MTSACRFVCVRRRSGGNPVQRYSKKNEQRKFATRLLLLLLDCYRYATAMLLVIVFSESRIGEGKVDDPVQFVVHHAGVVVRVQIAVFLPLPHFFDQCARLIVSAG